MESCTIIMAFLPHERTLLLGDEHLVALLDTEGLVPGVNHRQSSCHTLLTIMAVYSGVELLAQTRALAR